ncbi:MAG: hypothetical protein QUU85_00490, partial [Candidatus Eisenbacteria bacterium]|nr:hypothetical protein [Candidatus Eisenbacteria bacterium]
SVPDSAAGPARVTRDSSAARPPEPAAARPGVRPAGQKPAGTRAKKEKGLRKQQRRLAWNQRRKGKG